MAMVAGSVVMATPVQQQMGVQHQMGMYPMGMPNGVVMGTAPAGVQQPRRTTLQCQVQVPKSVQPGETFTASTPDGQQLNVAVPSDAEPGATISFSYVPLVTASAGLGPAPAATVVGMPIGMTPLGMHALPQLAAHPGIHGLPPLGSLAALEYATMVEGEHERKDRQHSEIGWVLYCVGWGLCLCCGPIGPVFWFGVACMHWCRPKVERDRLPREHAMATVSLCTGAFGIAVALLLLIVAVTHSVRGGHVQDYDDQAEQDSHQHQHRMHGHW